MGRDIKLILGLLLAICSSSNVVYGYSSFTNFKAAFQINGIIETESEILAATGGGLLHIERSTGRVFLEKDNFFPDLDMTSICRDKSQNLWIGTYRGYLYRIDRKGAKRKYEPYVVSDWKINDMYSFGDYLIVSSDKGCSIFDCKKEMALQNATSFKGLKSSDVKCVEVIRNKLYLGCGDGIAVLDSLDRKILSVNFLDETIWKTQPRDSTVLSFQVIGDSVVGLCQPSGVWNNTVIVAALKDSMGMIRRFLDDSLLVTVGSEISTIVQGDNGSCLFGTIGSKALGVAKWNGLEIKNYIPAMLTTNNVLRICLDPRGDLWTTPFGDRQNIRWWQAINRFHNGVWQYHNKSNTNNFGGMGDGVEFIGIAADNQGNVWFGNNGDNIKQYNSSKDKWYRYSIANVFKKIPENQDGEWGKCDAIAQDSSGNMWFGIFNGKIGSVVCYKHDPGLTEGASLQYRFLLMQSDAASYIGWPKAINVDDRGNVYIGSDAASNKLVVLSFSGDPISSGYKSNVTSGYGGIFDMNSIGSGCTWVVSEKALYLSQCISDSVQRVFSVDNAPKNILCAKTEYTTDFTLGGIGRMEGAIWFGTLGEGLGRALFHLDMNQKGEVTNAVIEPDSIVYYTVKDGLVSTDEVRSLALDKNNGYLWAATKEGLSRYYIGHRFNLVTDNKKVSVYPNPFVRSRHQEIVFRYCTPGASIYVYTADGRFVEQIMDNGGNVIKTANEWTFVWKPTSRMLPGTYLYSIKKQSEISGRLNQRVIGKILILP